MPEMPFHATAQGGYPHSGHHTHLHCMRTHPGIRPRRPPLHPPARPTPRPSVVHAPNLHLSPLPGLHTDNPPQTRYDSPAERHLRDRRQFDPRLSPRIPPAIPHANTLLPPHKGPDPARTRLHIRCRNGPLRKGLFHRHDPPAQRPTSLNPKNSGRSIRSRPTVYIHAMAHLPAGYDHQLAAGTHAVKVGNRKLPTTGQNAHAPKEEA